MYPRLLQFGHFAIPTYGALSGLAIVAGLTAALFFARRLGVDPNKIWTLCLIGVLTTLVSARLMLVVAYFQAFRAHPFWVLGLTHAPNAVLTALSVTAGVGAAGLYALAEGLPLLKVMDALVPCAALSLAVHDVGAFIAGLDYGLPTASGWSVVYTSRLAALWYRTPLGISLYPVQAYAALAWLVIFVLLAWWMRRRTQDGEMVGVWLFLAGISEFVLDFYRAGEWSWVVFAVEMLAVVSGGALWMTKQGSGNSDQGLEMQKRNLK